MKIFFVTRISGNKSNFVFWPNFIFAKLKKNLVKKCKIAKLKERKEIYATET